MLADRLVRRLRHILSGSLSDAQLDAFAREGFLILPLAFDAGTCARIRAHVEWMWENRASRQRQVVSCYNGEPNAHRQYFRKADDFVRAFSHTLLDPHLEEAPFRDLVTAPVLTSALRQLLGANPLVCNSLYFEKGSQQDPHFDTFFMPSPTVNKMAAAWIAIDTVTPDSGPLYYYPRSHLIEPYKFSDGRIQAVFSESETGARPHIERIIAEHGLKREIFLPRAGDVLIWHAQVMHGAIRIEDPRLTRRSVVAHYWTDLDFPAEDQRIDFGGRRWVLKRDHQFVVDDDVLAEVDAFIATLEVTEEMRGAVPESFDARRYLSRNQDVLRARVNPWVHYMDHGRQERRIW
jgi:ectoine hydroxylase-related dioxygenase (phytanoyl-CoA dioxygenase family)